METLDRMVSFMLGGILETLVTSVTSVTLLMRVLAGMLELLFELRLSFGSVAMCGLLPGPRWRRLILATAGWAGRKGKFSSMMCIAIGVYDDIGDVQVRSGENEEKKHQADSKANEAR